MITIMDFYTTWCGPCQKQHEVLKDLEKSVDSVEVEFIDAEDNIDLAKEYKVMSVPMLVFKVDGEEKLRLSGFQPFDKIKEAINSL